MSIIWVLLGVAEFIVLGSLACGRILGMLATSRYCPLWLAKECWANNWECGRKEQ